MKGCRVGERKRVLGFLLSAIADALIPLYTFLQNLYDVLYIHILITDKD
jgi:hypothetical protein